MIALWNNLKVVMLLLMVVWAEVTLITDDVELKKAETNVIPKEKLWIELPPHV